MTDTTADTTCGLRERKKRATRQALQHAAIRLFLERGVEAVTVEDICTRAEVSPRTFFNYFTAKEEVLVPWNSDIVARTAQAVLAQPADHSPIRVAHTVLGSAIDSAMAAPTWRDQAQVLRAHPELMPRVVLASRALEAALADGLAQRLGRDRDDLYVRLLASTAITAMRTSIQSWHQAGPEVDPHEFLDRAFDLLGSGMPPD
ncbi:TetR family transcriptional regulator [Saccharopolyspora sp. WRP15-2]|uniref:TetR family transcriptional regulator n=1 Tax=Saccharopolyspora oryzae TaxID=2997343 RepID=A0ABT4V1F2_9PSEU|nr:TetR family transcriptional regulator [Saccharopolyspora oryzae]MDA3627249.1 TetR family transcriptional regulator [Saccharopolyspora oryzae]